MKQTAKLRNGLMLAMSALLIGCCELPRQNVKIPNYSAEYLEQLAHEYESKEYGEATVRAIDDYSIIMDR